MKRIFASLRTREISFPYWLLAALMAVGYVSGLFVPLMDNDSAHHGTIALNMFNSGDWASLVEQDGMAYLDKPHFQFWLIAAGYKLFGVGDVGYKISSFLFTLAGLWATYRLMFHLTRSGRTARYAVLLLASFAAFALANVDVRMEAILTATIIIAVWQGVMHLDTGKFFHLVLAALGLAMAFGTKGWVGVMVPFFSLTFYMAGSRKLAWLVSWKFPVLLLLFFAFISPVLYAFYLQFDCHPELVVRGRDHLSGVLFILWGQIFDRMGGTYGRSSSHDYFFFLHTMLWAILPWSFLFYTLLFRKGYRLAVRKTRESFSPVCWLTLPAILLTIAALSVSQFKLPHYLNVVFPFIAVFMAEALAELKPSKLLKGLGIMQKVVAVVLLVAVVLVNYVCFPVSSWWVSGCLVAGMAVMAGLLFCRTESVDNMVKTGVFLSALVWFSLNLNFYPQLLTYQGGNEIALKTVRPQRIPSSEIGLYKIADHSYSFDVYTGEMHREWSDETIRTRLANGQQVYLLAEPSGLDQLRQAGYALHIVDERPDYRITRLTGKFLNPRTRASVVSRLYLVRVMASGQK